MVTLTQEELDLFGSKIKFVYLPDGELDREACWEWTGKHSKQGQHYIKMGNKPYQVDRLAYMLEKGEIPNRMKIKRNCGNLRCVNPDHLELDSNSDVHHRYTKLTNDQIKEILIDINNNKYSNIKQICIKYNTNYPGIRNILVGESRKSLTSSIAHTLGVTLKDIYEKLVPPKLTEEERNKNSRRIKKEEVKDIIFLLKWKNVSILEVSRRFNMSYNQVKNIKDNYERNMQVE